MNTPAELAELEVRALSEGTLKRKPGAIYSPKPGSMPSDKLPRVTKSDLDNQRKIDAAMLEIQTIEATRVSNSTYNKGLRFHGDEPALAELPSPVETRRTKYERH